MQHSVSPKPLAYLAILPVALSLCCLTARADDIGFEFNVPGVLPSSQGATYFGIGAPESAAFSVSGGILHQDTTIFGSDVMAGYFVPDILDHSVDATMEWSAQVQSGAASGIQTVAQDDGFQWNFILTNNAILAYDGTHFSPIIAMDTTDAFHAYRAVIPANSTNFDFYVDSVLRFSGTAPTAPAQSYLFWGDGTPTGGNGAADWDYVRLTNPVTQAVPEPGPVALFLGAACTGIIVLRRKRRA